MNLLDKKCGLWAALALRCRAAHLLPSGATLAGALGVSVATLATLTATPAYAQGSGVLTGTVLDTATKRPIPDVVVTVTTTSASGFFVAVSSTVPVMTAEPCAKAGAEAARLTSATVTAGSR